ncbi:two component sensor and regulator histidine kinase response regulator [Legionella nautarum]|uniref:Two component sensor and regulator histidine kinase response regulator n=1 Tax=Legionella nautarum TaxID=45070 RepID=A0A0W0WN59_9GAMM|nr:response regulator [Legionella nautarum]KTD33781.1 two component sensor and regulator histidine kinase response regulator [Legionella nautarum]
MRILIVEDNAFNAFCLSRLLETINKQIKLKLVNDSLSALCYLAQYEVALIILDGDLGASDGVKCNGPALADVIWLNHPSIPIIAWSDSEEMRTAFSAVFRKHNKEFNDYSCWKKEVKVDLIQQSLPFLMIQNSFNHLTKAENTDSMDNFVMASAFAS